MLIRPSISTLQSPSDRAALAQQRHHTSGIASTPVDRVDTVSFKEQAIRSAVLGASLGTVAGEALGKIAIVGASGYLGWQVGESLAGPAAGAVGALVGSGASYFLERKLSIGGTLGAVSGFLTGGVIGGVVGSVISGVQTIAHAHPFQ